VLASLVDNAVKFSPAGSTVTVAARGRRKSVEVSVADRGIGVPSSERERIFRKFYRGDTAGGRGAERGTGVGLFIAKGLVEKMGGSIRVEPNDGEGSRFSVELPLATGTGAGRVNESERQRVKGRSRSA
jgi:signal transduction histidine kinase